MHTLLRINYGLVSCFINLLFEWGEFSFGESPTKNKSSTYPPYSATKDFRQLYLDLIKGEKFNKVLGGPCKFVKLLVSSKTNSIIFSGHLTLLLSRYYPLLVNNII